MQLGIPKEIKDRENRVALTPGGARELVAAGHDVAVERGAGEGSGYADADYVDAGARIVDRDAAWGAELVVKIKEPLEAEYGFLGAQIVFTYLHLAGVAPALTDVLLQRGTTAIAYETVQDADARLPLLAPMSAVAGTMAVVVGNYYLAKFSGGRGMLLGRVMGERYGRILIVGDGIVGRHAAAAGLGLGAHVCLAGRHEDRVPQLREASSPDLRFVLSTPENLARELGETDLLVGAVLRPGARAPQVVSRAMVAAMPAGSVVVDVSIDQGGCVETARPTSHSDPVYVDAGVTHYCVTNMPGAYPRTSTTALTAATLPYVRALADGGLPALRRDAGFAMGVNTFRGRLTCRPVAEALGRLPDYAAFGDLD